MSLLPPLRRSMLYVPGQHQAMIDEARRSLADVVCLDLEDNVPPAEKANARSLVAAAVAKGDFRALEVTVRVNTVDQQELELDLAMLRAAGVRDVLIPKVSTPNDLKIVREGLGPGPLRLWAMIESARGLLNCREIAAEDDVTALVIGGGDLATDLRLPPADAPFGLQLHGAAVVVAARAFGRSAIDGITVPPSAPNPCGFDGRSTFPGQDVGAINAAFSPSKDEVAQARAALERPYAYGDHLIAAQRKLDLAARAAARDALLARAE